MLQSRRKVAFFTGQDGCTRWPRKTALISVGMSWISLSFSSNYSLCFFFVYPRTWADVFSMAYFRFFHKVSGWGFNCYEIWLAFAEAFAQAADIELLYGISFLLQLGFELQFEPTTGAMVVGTALRTGYFSRVKNVLRISLTHMHIVMKMPILGPRMYPGGLHAILFLKIVFLLAS